MHLHSQYLQAGLGQPGFQLCGAALPLPIFLEIPKRMSHPRQEPAKKQVAEKVSGQSHPHENGKSAQLGMRTINKFDDGEVHHQFCQGKDDAGADVQSQPLRPGARS